MVTAAATKVAEVAGSSEAPVVQGLQAAAQELGEWLTVLCCAVLCCAVLCCAVLCV
jgi:hypothetical protein